MQDHRRPQPFEQRSAWPLRTSNWTVAALVIAVSSIIAVTLTLIQSPAHSGWVTNLLISNAIGFCIWGLIHAQLALSAGRIGLLPAIFIAIPLGIVAGGKAAALIGAPDFIASWMQDPVHQWRWIGISLLFSASAAIFISVSSRAINYRMELEIERRRHAEERHSQAVAELALLQAQIEPHFLFNTLAHIQSAVEQDPAIGKRMLEHLIRYLRSTLRRSRNSFCTLAEELELIESLLAIASMRLGPRLRVRMMVPDALSRARLPPLLLQPLVENAIKHGIEPAIDGGEISIAAEQTGDLMLIRVADTGIGMASAAPEGVGLSNVRARLAGLYGEKGRLALRQHPSRGVIAELQLPLQWS